MDRAELLQLVDGGRTKLEAALAGIDEHQYTNPLLPGGWSVKDLLGHIGFWERRIAGLYDILVAGDEPQDVVSNETVDELNARVYQDNLLVPLGITRLNEEEAFAAIRAVAENAPEDDLFNPHRFPWTQGTPFHRFIAENTYEHYADHIPDLLAME
jgi:hypothetical protein